MLTNNTQQLIEGVLRHGPDILAKCFSCDKDLAQYFDRVEQERLNYPLPKSHINVKNWNIPDRYKSMDIEEFLVDQCPSDNYDRLIKELELFKKYEMLMVLRTMKYIVDTLRKNNTVWGVGRGSSVASYVLFLIGVHKIDSVKYNLPIEEFFKEI